LKTHARQNFLDLKDKSEFDLYVIENVKLVRGPRKSRTLSKQRTGD